MPMGHWSKGPAWLAWNSGVLWFLPNQDVAYPLSFRMVPMVALSLVMMLSYPGKPVACSATTPKPAEWWLRPVISAARVGELSAVEWKFVYRSPALAIRSRAGVGMTPPKVLGTPNPASSVIMSRTLGAPLGGTMRGCQ